MELKKEIQDAIAQSKPTMLEFYADWCPHCQRMKPVMDALKREVADNANIIQIEGDKNRSLMDYYVVDSFPTFIVFKNQKETWRKSGEQPLSTLKAELL